MVSVILCFAERTGICPEARPASRPWTLGERFQVVDAFGSVDVAEDVHDGPHRGRVGGVVDHHGGEIVVYRAAGALAFAEDFRPRRRSGCTGRCRS
jgi:hypothetical protein